MNMSYEHPFISGKRTSLFDENRVDIFNFFCGKGTFGKTLYRGVASNLLRGARQQKNCWPW
jgi:hypothetical protein